MLKRTKIVATVGPASDSREEILALVEAGVDVFRVNFSHGNDEQRDQFLQNIRAAEREAGRPIAVCGDLCGPKIRVGMIQGGEVSLQTGQEIVIQRLPQEGFEGTAQRISTTLAELVDVVRVGETILLADGRLRFEVIRTSAPEDFTCRVTVGGTLASGKGVNLPETQLAMSALTEKDREDIRWIAQRDFDYVALSFVQRGADVDELRTLLQEQGSDARIIAKIEKPQAIDHIDAIIATADAIMVARGDLGVEMDFPTVPMVQKMIARKCQIAGKPCIIATEMLESMIDSPRPTRAEVSDVSNAVFDHADAVMLSAESAIGKYPVQAVHAMRRTVMAAEQYLDQHPQASLLTIGRSTTAALAASVHHVMEMKEIAAIAAFTASGATARLLGKNRPECPILALASKPEIARRTCLYYGVVPQVIEMPADVQLLLKQINTLTQDLHLAKKGDRIIALTGHPVGTAGGTRAFIINDVT